LNSLLHLLTDCIDLLLFRRFLGRAKVELLLFGFSGHRVDGLLKGSDELLQLITRQVVLDQRDRELNWDAVAELVPRVVLVEHLQSPHRLHSEAVVAGARHLQHRALVGRHFTLLVWHESAPGTVTFLERSGHREADRLREVLLGRHSRALRLEHCQGTDLSRLLAVDHHADVRSAHTASEEQVNTNCFHCFFALGIVRGDFDADLLTHGEDLFGNFNRELSGLSAAEETEAALKLFLVVESLGLHGRGVDGGRRASDDEFTAASVVRAIVVLVDLDGVVCVNGDELSADLVHVHSNLAVPALRGEETGLAVRGHLEGEGERELANLALVLVGLKVKQVKVLPLHDRVISVIDFRLLTRLIEESVLRTDQGNNQLLGSVGLLLLHIDGAVDHLAGHECVDVVLEINSNLTAGENAVTHLFV